jgi:hypothetical protein
MEDDEEDDKDEISNQVFSTPKFNSNKKRLFAPSQSNAMKSSTSSAEIST